MSVSLEKCVTLAEYRQQVLAVSQWEIAEIAKCSQGSVSKVELGWLPKAAGELRVRLLKAYQLQRQDEHFVRMVQNAQRLKALRTHIAEDFPLALFAEPSKEAGGLVVPMPPAPLLIPETRPSARRGA